MNQNRGQDFIFESPRTCFIKTLYYVNKQIGHWIDSFDPLERMWKFPSSRAEHPWSSFVTLAFWFKFESISGIVHRNDKVIKLNIPLQILSLPAHFLTNSILEARSLYLTRRKLANINKYFHKLFICEYYFNFNDGRGGVSNGAHLTSFTDCL